MNAKSANPLILPEWQALHREASLVCQLIGAGITSLGRADYATGLGEYYTAFFGISIGIERLAKLSLVADYAITNNGALPDQSAVRRFGHDLKRLCENAGYIATKYSLNLTYSKPTSPISSSALNCLSSFADASKGRYANFEAIGNPTFDRSIEPINRWWNEVIEPILDLHYRGRISEQRIKKFAGVTDSLIGSYAAVYHIDESGSAMTDIATAAERTGQTQWAQKFGRFYTLSIIRWLADIFRELSLFGTYQKDLPTLFGHWELLNTYRVEDKYLRNRKKWPLF